MSTANKLSYLNDTKSLLRTSLNKFGSSILSTDTFRSYDTKLNEIYDKLPKITQSGAGFTLENVQNGQVDDFKMIGVDLEQNTTNGINKFYLDNNYSANYGEASIEVNNNNSFILRMNKTSSNKQSPCATIEFNASYLKPNTTYTISKKNSNTGYVLEHVGSIRLYINGSYGSFIDADEYTFTTPGQITNFTILLYLFFGNSTPGNYEITFYDIQLEENSTATDFEPYTGGIPSPNPDYPQEIKVVEGRQVINISNDINNTSYNIDLNLENIYLAKMPDTNYKNRIYKNNGNWYFERNVEKYIIDGTESWITQSAYSGYYRYMFVLMENYKNDNLSYGVVGMNSHFIQRITQPHGDYEYLYLQAANNNLLSVYIQIKNLSTIANFKTWLSENNVVVWYPLVNPVTTQITNTTLINQLEAISVYTGTNIITISNDNNMTPEIEITRLKELERLS